MDRNAATPRTRAALTRQEQQLIKHSSQVPARSLNRQAILTEEEYTEGLERIIARDFFPVLSEKYARKEYEEEILQGFTSNDPDVIERSVRRVEDWMDTEPAWSVRYKQRNVQRTPRLSTYTNDTPRRGDLGETPNTNDRPAKRQKLQRYDDSLSLDEFQAKYTSEDNASFAEILDQENAARRVKYSWAYQAEQTANDKARRAIQAREKLVDLARRIAEGDGEVRMIEGIEAGRPGERLLIEGRQNLPGDKASLEFAKRRLIAAPQKGVLLIEGSKEGGENGEEGQTAEEREQQMQLALREKHEEAERTRGEAKDIGNVQGWPMTARNSFYFAPDANIPINKMATHPLNRQKSGFDKMEEFGTMEPKSIRYSNTRLFSEAELDSAARKAGMPPSPSRSNIAAAINGTPYPGRNGGNMTPQVRGYSFVDAMPSPSASTLGENGLKSLMTFGTLASTPIALRDPNAGDPAFSQAASDALQEGPFKIPTVPRREQLAHKMAGKATKSLQQRHGLNFGNSGLGLRKNAGSVRREMTPKEASVRVAQRQMEEGDTTPSKDAFLSPAARTLLGRTTLVAGKARHASPFAAEHSARRADQDRERMSMNNFAKQRWDPSPVNAGTSGSKR